MILPWAHRLISAGAHGMRRIPGQSVNLAHPLFGAHHAPRPLTKVHPRWFPRGAMGVGCNNKAVSSRTAKPSPRPCAAKSTGVPALRFTSAGMAGLVERSVLSRTPLPQAMPT